MTFDCNRCGACCRVAGAVPGLEDYDRGDGVCMHLTDANECEIYRTRPQVCRVDDMCPDGTPMAEWHAANAAECKKLRLHVYGQ